MLAIIAPRQPAGRRTVRTVAVAGRDREELLVSWLSEVVFLLETAAFVPAAFSVREITETPEGLRLRADVHGETLDPGRHELKTEIKAVTYHGLSVTRTAEGLSVEVIFDV